MFEDVVKDHFGPSDGLFLKISNGGEELIISGNGILDEVSGGGMTAPYRLQYERLGDIRAEF